ncbi:MAG: Hsp20/alpha crystallin family protein, partial [Victivallaceae bacterium]|nr:Hsp20/alpha crystallin family protein [Victivallaceae bacterium]
MSDKELQNENFYDVRPATDVEETENGAVVTIEIPGVPAAGVTLDVKDRVLELSAVGTLRRNGIPIRYRRAFELSDAVDVENITAKTRDGVLT